MDQISDKESEKEISQYNTADNDKCGH
jgi:hypothetical protein